MLSRDDPEVVFLRILFRDDQINTQHTLQLVAIDYQLKVVLLADDRTVGQQVLIALEGLNLEAIPVRGNLLFPCGDLLSHLIVVRTDVSRTSSQLVVETIVVVVEHTLHRVVRSDLGDRVLDILDPVRRVTLAVLSVVSRDDLSLQHVIDRSRVELILILLVLVSTLVGQCPTGALNVTLIPPTIEDREVQYTVHLSLLTRCTGSLQRTCRCVQPNINTRDQAASQTHIVVLEEDDLTQELRTARDLDDVLDQALTTAIGRVCLTCKYELDREFLVVNDLGQTVEVCEQQVRTLVSSEAAAETDQQGVRVDLLEDRDYFRRITLVLQPIVLILNADIIDQLVFQSLTKLPDLLVGDILDLLPVALVFLVSEELLAKFLSEELFYLRSGPSRHVYAVGYITYVKLLREVTFPYRSEHSL